MQKFIIENDFFKVFPEAKIGVIIAKGINNEASDDEKYKRLLRVSEKEVNKYLTDAQFSNNKVISIWRDAFKKFKTKKGARSSIEAMLKRVSKGNEIGNINPLVDIYNSISLKYALPCGGEDINTFVGDMKLTKAIGDESFITYGSDKSEPPYENEIIYKDDAGAVCRCFNWRESVRTMLVEETENAFLCIENLDSDRENEFKDALEELKELIQNNLGGKLEVKILDIDNPEINLL